ncbi:MAG: TetR/AcrR family transcriptional regulator [Thermodesulfobacteriota bacterium]
MTEMNTKERLLDTAERLFAEKGVKETSVRKITREAGSNLASVNYHFGSKYGLIRAVIVRRIEPLNMRRFELLDTYEAEAGDRHVPIDRVLYALIAPSIEMYLDNPNFLRFAGRMISDPDKDLHRIFASQLDQVFYRVKGLLMRTLPNLPESELLWRLHFTIGAMIHTWTNHSDLELRSGGICKITDIRSMVSLLINFCEAGLKAEVPDVIE